MKRCPFCAEEIQDAAILCRFCGRDLEAPQPPKPDSKETPKAGIGGIALLIGAGVLLLGLVVSLFTGSTPANSSSDGAKWMPSVSDVSRANQVIQGARNDNVIYRTDDARHRVYVDPAAWAMLEFDVKQGLARSIWIHYRDADGADDAWLYDSKTGRLLAWVSESGAVELK